MGSALFQLPHLWGSAELLCRSPLVQAPAGVSERPPDLRPCSGGGRNQGSISKRQMQNVLRTNGLALNVSSYFLGLCVRRERVRKGNLTPGAGFGRWGAGPKAPAQCLGQGLLPPAGSPGVSAPANLLGARLGGLLRCSGRSSVKVWESSALIARSAPIP